MSRRPGLLTIDELKAKVDLDQIDTVVVAITDMQGRLQGKRLVGVGSSSTRCMHHGTEGCNYLMAVDVDMNTVDGYAMSSWERGYGDFVMAPDYATLRLMPVAAGHRAGPRRRPVGGRHRRRRRRRARSSGASSTGCPTSG